MADLESVIVGGAIAIAGGLATQLLLEYHKQKAEKKKKKAEKLEELISLLSEYTDRHILEVDHENFEKQATLLNAKINAIFIIHFPQYLLAYHNLRRIDIASEEAWKDCIDKSNNLVKELSEYAEREFKQNKILSLLQLLEKDLRVIYDRWTNKT